MSFVDAKIFFVLILLFFTFPAFAQSDDIPFLTVKTDDSHYDEGDTVVISGQLATIIVDTPIILQLWYEGNLLDAAQFDPAQDGSYSYTIIAEKPNWRHEGEYLIIVSHGNKDAETTLTFTPKQEFPETTESFEVEIPNGGTFDVEYTIIGGTVKDMIFEPDNFTLQVLIEAPDEGTISLNLPRESIDADGVKDEDKKFIILIDGVQFPYEEIETNPQSRLITINFDEKESKEPMSTYKIEIIGTFAIPEFGTIITLILVFGVIITIGFTKNKFQFKI